MNTAVPERTVAGRLSFVDRYLAVWIPAAMAAGPGLGRLLPGLGDAPAEVTVTAVSLPIALGLVDDHAGELSMSTADEYGITAMPPSTPTRSWRSTDSASTKATPPLRPPLPAGTSSTPPSCRCTVTSPSTPRAGSSAGSPR